MSDMWRKTLVYLGLVEEPEEHDEREAERDSGEDDGDQGVVQPHLGHDQIERDDHCLGRDRQAEQDQAGIQIRLIESIEMNISGQVAEVPHEQPIRQELVGAPVVSAVLRLVAAAVLLGKQ
jgi:hypothetical protein